MDFNNIVQRLEKIEQNQSEILAFVSVFKQKLIESQIGFYQPQQSVNLVDQQAIDKQQQIWGNVQLIRSVIAASDYQMITALVTGWSDEFKKDIYAQLTTSEKDILKKMKAAYEQYLKPAYEAYQNAVQSGNVAQSQNQATVSNISTSKPVQSISTDSDDDEWAVSTRSESEAKDNLGGSDESVARESVSTWQPKWNANTKVG